MLMAKARQSIGDPLVPVLGHSSVNLAFRPSRVAVQMQLQVREKGRLRMQGDRKWNSARPKQCELLQRTGCFCVLGTAFPYCDAQRTRDTLTASQYYRLGGEIAQQGNGFVKMNQSDHNCVSGIELCQQMVSCGYILCYGTKGKQTITTGATNSRLINKVKPKKTHQLEIPSYATNFSRASSKRSRGSRDLHQTKYRKESSARSWKPQDPCRRGSRPTEYFRHKQN
ncbi:hypothetical protein DER44DRAFT_744464 [Fusarium oxysporum]|nr:hypothetical protein DER44DRAFT_744464 [Fusarium oxysporum]